MLLLSALNEYCTLLNGGVEKSRRMRTHAAAMASGARAELPPALMMSLSESVDRPRATSKSGVNAGSLGTLANALSISFCSSAEGVQTFNTLTFT